MVYFSEIVQFYKRSMEVVKTLLQQILRPWKMFTGKFVVFMYMKGNGNARGDSTFIVLLVLSSFCLFATTGRQTLRCFH